MLEQARYEEYLSRWERDVGPAEVGTFAKFGGRLIKKLSAEEFGPLVREYDTLAQRYLESVERGDTVNDVLVRLVRERAAALLVVAPV